jgi:lipopolysaccharide export LptBFGC system permease protein LptF
MAAQGPTMALPSNAHSEADRAAASAHIELTRPLFAVAAVGVLTALVTLAIFDRERGAGVAVGAVLATANFWIFSRIGMAILRRPERSPSFALVAPLKLAFLFGAVLAVLKGQLAGPIDFLAGYLALPVGIVVAQLLGRRSFLEHQHSTF